jgi:hypothetical protein
MSEYFELEVEADEMDDDLELAGDIVPSDSESNQRRDRNLRDDDMKLGKEGSKICSG